MYTKEPLIIVQARTGSSRLPSKVILPFYNKKCILEIIINKLKEKYNYSIVVATTTNQSDNVIESLSKKLNVQVFRGNENNVLNRFIGCAESVKAETLVRVCADNPFLDLELMSEIIEQHMSSFADYTSFITQNGMPVIKTHYGIFAEVVELSALKKVEQHTTNSLFLEHVTNYIYLNPSEFELNFIPIPEFLSDKHIRLTLDSKEDWEVLTELYAKCVLHNNYFDTKVVTDILATEPKMLLSMHEQILKFSK